jgi:hypothetical protein
VFFGITQMNEIVKLADELLPSLPVGTISLPVYSGVHMKGCSVKKSTSSKQGEHGSTANELSGREKLLRDQPELLQQFGMDLLPTMTQVSLVLLMFSLMLLMVMLMWYYGTLLLSCWCDT